ncbi:DUF1822 family protein [Thermocoleostomius sinensis]|uniref:DUF1822 family protein n=1 Tax=Thermocoleostomius sinensis A174 TaxID=2016057 RepID=A0A9E9CC44_9CYAN|nr:DUF1822 family protein [Thermocoleostomius sinensis]WAL61940.1 DUF1822 family protein [Thermocoleostomius sinensis A174]
MISPVFAAEPTDIYLTPSPTAWQQVAPLCSRSSRRWMAQIHQLCLDAVLQWLRTDYPRAIATPINQVSYWEFVDGCAVELDRTTHPLRLVFIPSTALDTSELRVAQEWVDLPSWVGHCYLPVQVEPDDGWMRVWGFVTHRRLKQQGVYDAGDRTYAVTAEQLIQDMNVLWEAYELCPQELAQVPLAALPPLSLAQAENLIARLGSPEIVLPQFELPFAQWGALLEHGGWRQRLYQRRVGLPEQWSVRQWLTVQVSQLAEQAGWERIEVGSMAGARGSGDRTSSVLLSRSLHIAEQSYQLQIFPEGAMEQNIWRFELRRLPTSAETDSPSIPQGTKLRLLTEDLQPFDNNEATAQTTVDRLYIVVALTPGEGLVWEVEPTPEGYQREILRF